MKTNIEKMKETLVLIADVAESLESSLKRDSANHAQIEMAASIVTSARKSSDYKLRNCDVGTPQEQIARHQNYCGNGSGNIRCINNSLADCNQCFAKWMQLPYQEGETKCI